MEYPVSIAGCEQQNVVVKTGFLFGPKVLINGTPAPRGSKRRTFTVKRTDGADTVVALKFVPWDPLPKLVINGEVIVLGAPLSSFQKLWAMLPIIPLSTGGALGGALGFGAAYTSVVIFRSNRSRAAKYTLTAAVSIVAAICYLVLAGTFRPAAVISKLGFKNGDHSCSTLRPKDGVDASIDRAVLARCDQGDSEGCMNLADTLMDGRPATNGLLMTWAAERACEGGFANGCAVAGAGYQYGGVGRVDSACAYTWFDRGCRGKSTLACFSLGEKLYGGDGIAQDKARGVELVKRACTEGSDLACSTLGDMGVAPPKNAAEQ